jgi:tyrosyl-tRNA synthetase
MPIIVDKNRIEEIFLRGTVDTILPTKESFIKELTSGKKLKIYIGFDPTSTALHLGHAKNLIFLEEMRQLGHEAIVLFGDFTAQIGDPSDKKTARKQLTPEQIKSNILDWMRQARMIVNFDDKINPARVVYNSEWLSKLTFADVANLAINFTVQQMLERDMFEKRLKENTPIYLHEFLYPLMQGYDSVAMDVDVEVCGTDQTFNALAGRTLLKRLKDKEKFVVALNLVANPKTGELMSKSNGTGVFIDQTPELLFGSIMALPDPMIEPLFLNCTRIPMSDKDGIMALGPRDAKARIAFDIVRRFHGEDSATKAEQAFETTFAKGGIPDDIENINFKKGDVLSEVLVKAGVIPSKAEWRRLIDGGAVRDENDEKITDPNYSPIKTIVLKIGKRRFVKIIVSQ